MNHLDPQRDVRGESQYLDDVPTQQGTLYAAVFESPLAHGKLLKLELGAALAAPGVVRILTADDIPGHNQIGGIVPDEPLLAHGHVHFRGQPVALALARTEHQVQAALKLIQVDIEPLPVITDPRVAAAQGELIVPPRTFRIGDSEASWASCAHVFEGVAESGGQEHLYIETQGAYAFPTEMGGVRLISSTQGPTAVQRHTAHVLGLGMHQVEVDVTRLGGGFGGKEDQATPWGALAALGAFITKKPAKLVLDRMADMRMTGKRHPYSSDFKIGLDENLRILAYEVTFYQNAGAAADLSPAVLERTLFHATNAYFIPNVTATAYSCRTNLLPNTAFRGFGGPQGMFVVEAAIAKAAEELGMPASLIQRKNLLRENDLFPYGQPAEMCHAEQAWDTTAQLHDLPGLRAEVEQFNQCKKLIKKELSVMPICFGISFTKTPMNQARALVHIYSDGSVGISTGAVEMGQGVNTKIAQVAARTLGISIGRVKVETTNTTRVANTSPAPPAPPLTSTAKLPKWPAPPCASGCSPTPAPSTRSTTKAWKSTTSRCWPPACRPKPIGRNWFPRLSGSAWPSPKMPTTPPPTCISTPALTRATPLPTTSTARPSPPSPSTACAAPTRWMPCALPTTSAKASAKSSTAARLRAVPYRASASGRLGWPGWYTTRCARAG